MTTSANWFYMRGDQQQGPVTLDDLRRLLAQGELSGSDLAWSAGMPQWMMAGQIPALQAPPRAVPVEMGYYTPMMGMPQRAVDNLRNHAAPRGDTGDWPLDDARVQCFEQTVKLRKRVMAAARLYHLMLLLAVIFAVVMVIVGLATVATAPARGRQWGMFLAMLIPGGFFVGLCVLYYFSWRDNAVAAMGAADDVHSVFDWHRGEYQRVCPGDGCNRTGGGVAGRRFGDRADFHGGVCGGVVAGVRGDSAVPVAAGVVPGVDRQGESVTAGVGQGRRAASAVVSPGVRLTERRRACHAWMTAGIREMTMIARITTWKWVLTQGNRPKR